MEYIVALLIYVVSIFGAIYATYCLMRFKDDKAVVSIMGLSLFAFTCTMYLGGTMLKAMN